MGHIIKEFNVIHVNIRGLSQSKTELDMLINERQPHVITLNETHLLPTDKLSYQNYNVIRKDRRDRRRGGAAILYHKHLPITEVELPKQFQKLDALIVKIHIPNWPLHVSTLYNPPNKPLPVELIKYLSKFHKSILLSDANAHHPILGDNPSISNRQGRELADLLQQSNFIQVTLPGPTRYPQSNRETFTSPDKVLATNPVFNRIKSTTLHDPPNSDHVPIQIILTTPYWRPTSQNDRKTILDYEAADWDKFQQIIEETIQDNTIKTIDDIDMYDKKLITTINKAITQTVPVKRIKINKLKHNHPLPDYIIKTIKTKRRAHRLYMKTKKENDRRLYRQLQEDVKAAITFHKSQKYHHLTQEIQTNWQINPKRFWQNINKLRGRKTFGNHPLKIGKETFIMDEEKAEIFRSMLQEIYRIPRSDKFHDIQLQEAENFVNLAQLTGTNYVHGTKIIKL